MMTDPSMRLLQDIQNAATVVRAFSASDSAMAMRMMLGAVIETYKLQLIDVAPDQLESLQARIKQTQAILGVVSNESSNGPLI